MCLSFGFPLISFNSFALIFLFSFLWKQNKCHHLLSLIFGNWVAYGMVVSYKKQQRVQMVKMYEIKYHVISLFLHFAFSFFENKEFIHFHSSISIAVVEQSETGTATITTVSRRPKLILLLHQKPQDLRFFLPRWFFFFFPIC